MTPEQKAEAYDEALRQIKECTPDENGFVTICPNEIFPEFRESEDEKIREWLVEHQQAWLHDQESGRYMDNKNLIKSIKKSIEWLEKQGETYKDKESYELAEKEKYDFVSGKFIQCKKSFNEFKENNNYWLEYVGNDTYIGRSDNILNKKFHITPRQLYQLFTQPKENNVNEETNTLTAYGKYVDECLNDATKHFFSEGEDTYSVADLFYAGVRCGKSWVEKQRGNNNQNWEPSEEQLEASEYLENKNEQKNKINSYKIAVEITYEDILVLECAMKTVNLTGWDGANELYEKIVPLYNKIHNAYLIQLQSEQETTCDKCRKAQPSHSCQDITELGRCYAEHEQKPADKIEPNFNFKVGQWIVACGKCVFLITKIDGFNVTLVDANGNESVFDAGSLDDAHLWTIQDANDGDVLASEGAIGIFESLGNHPDGRTNNDNSYCNLHCRFDDFFYADFESGNIMDSSYNIHPATKEQCDLLFQKMKESGYKWDSEKRELREIEHESADKFEPKFKVGDWIVQKNLGIYKIVEVCESWYEVISYNDGTQYSIGFDKEKDCHLWTIKDAKDGDVLVSKSDNRIFLYNGKLDLRNRPCAYFGIYKTYDKGFRFTKCAIGNYFSYEDVHPSTKEQRDLLFQKMKEAGYEWDSENRELRKIEHEQKPTDKTKPKFKVGDWVVNGKEETAHIIEVGSDFYGTLRYYIEWTNGDKSDPMPCFVDNNFHLWTIKDAKDGDVLAVDGGSGICIFDGTVEDGIYPFAYCGLTMHYGFEVYDRILPFTHDNNVCPSTKEQRDTLTKAMTDAGYVFDFENKELKKISWNTSI